MDILWEWRWPNVFILEEDFTFQHLLLNVLVHTVTYQTGSFTCTNIFLQWMALNDVHITKLNLWFIESDANARILCYNPILFGVFLGVPGSLRPRVKMACFLYKKNKYSMMVKAPTIIRKMVWCERDKEGEWRWRGREISSCLLLSVITTLLSIFTHAHTHTVEREREVHRYTHDSR